MNKEKLNRALKTFKDYSQTTDFVEDTKEREERRKFFRGLFKRGFNELVFGEIIKKIWASRIFGNKDYLIDKILKENGINKLKSEFKQLISKRGTPGKRYETFLNNIKGMGPSMVTEILCYSDLKNAGIWNSIARKALAWLETKDVSFEKYRIDKNEYDTFNRLLKSLAGVLVKEKYEEVDLLFVDYFLWEIWNNFIKGKEEIIKQIVGPISKELSRHDELVAKISEIGSWLGFEVETEKLVANGAKVDDIWRATIANLGAVRYVFEVQDRGSIDSLMVNLQRAQTNPTVQKLIVISDKDQIDAIRKEIESMPENFRNSVVFWESKEVDDVHRNLEQVTFSISKLDLFKE